MAVEVRLLGRLEVVHEGRPVRLGRRRERCLLGLLLLEAGRSVPISRLIDLLWDGEPSASARTSLHSHVARLRACLDDGGVGPKELRLRGGSAGYWIDVDRQLVDAHRFRALAEQADRCAEPEARTEVLHDALAMWRGPVLEADASDRLRERIAANLDEQRITATEQLMDLRLARGRAQELISELTTLTMEYPFRERFTAQLMTALQRAGRQAEAIEAYQRLRQRLSDELGVDPGAELQDLHTAVLRGEVAPAPLPSLPVVARVPAQLPAEVQGFAGRHDELKMLDETLGGGDSLSTKRIAVVTGMAGVGKTALAVRWAHQVASRFPDGQLYANLRGFDALTEATSSAEAIRGFLDALGIPPERIPSAADPQLALYRSVLAGKRVLVVLDNARDAEQVRPLLPGTPTAVALITSRDQLAPLVAVDGAHPIGLDVMSAEEARELLVERLGPERVGSEPEAVKRILAVCGRLPLALAVTAARARQTGFPLATVAAELDDADQRLDMLDAGDEASRVRTVFSWSYRALNAPAARLFRLLGLHPGPDISLPAAASLAGEPVRETRRILTELTRANLLVEHEPARYALHDLLRAYAVEEAECHDDGDQRDAAVIRLLDHYVHTAHQAARLLSPLRDQIGLSLVPPAASTTPEDLASRPGAMSWLTAERQVLLAVLHHAADRGFDTRAWQLAWSLDTFLDRRGHWHDRSRAWHLALTAAHRLGGLPTRAYAHCSLGFSESQLGRHDQAQAHLEQALDLYGRIGDVVGQAHGHRILSFVCEGRGDVEGALDHARRGLALFETTGHRRWQAYALNSVGWYLSLTGDHLPALTYCEQALSLFTELGDVSGEANTVSSLGHAHFGLGDHPKAVACFTRSVALLRDLGDRYDEAEVLVKLGDVHRAAGDFAGARTAWQQARAIFDDLGHAASHTVGDRLRGLGQPRG